MFSPSGSEDLVQRVHQHSRGGCADEVAGAVWMVTGLPRWRADRRRGESSAGLDFWVGQDHVADRPDEVVVGLDEAAQRLDRRPVAVELVDREAIRVERPSEVRNPREQFLDRARVDRLVDACRRRDTAAIDADLPGVRDRQYDVPTHELRPMEAVPVRRNEEACPVGALAEDAVRALESRDAGPVQYV